MELLIKWIVRIRASFMTIIWMPIMIRLTVIGKTTPIMFRKWMDHIKSHSLSQIVQWNLLASTWISNPCTKVKCHITSSLKLPGPRKRERFHWRRRSLWRPRRSWTCKWAMHRLKILLNGWPKPRSMRSSVTMMNFAKKKLKKEIICCHQWRRPSNEIQQFNLATSFWRTNFKSSS